jgi:putative transport protein
MNWLFQMHTAQPVAHAIAVLALACVAGMAVGSLKVRGVGLGTAGVLFAGMLFAGILTGYFGKPVDHAMLEFVKEFGLILFVFTIGLQLGPGFLAALRQQGLAPQLRYGAQCRRPSIPQYRPHERPRLPAQT